jgi:hypothetical protein
MTRRKPLAVLAALTAAVAFALPVASAGAATTAPAVPAVSIGVGGLMSGSLACQMLVAQMEFATQTGNTLWANVLSNVFVYSGCGGAAI